MNRWKVALGAVTGAIGVTGAAVAPTMNKSSLQPEKKPEKKPEKQIVRGSATPTDLWTRYKKGTLGSHPENQKSLVSYYDPEKYEWWKGTYKKFKEYKGKKNSLFNDINRWGDLGYRCGQFYEQEIKGPNFKWYGNYDFQLTEDLKQNIKDFCALEGTTELKWS